jgi:hypothetical protein
VGAAALVLEEAGVGSAPDPVFVSASGADDPDRGASAVSSTCSALSTSSLSNEGEGSGETGDGLGEVDMEVVGERALGMIRCLVSRVRCRRSSTTVWKNGRARWLIALSAQL